MRQITLTGEDVRKATKPKPRFVIPDEPVRYEVHGDTLYIIIPALPPSKNQYIRKHWRTQQRLWFKPWEEMMRNTVGNSIKFKGVVAVEIELHFPNKMQRDVLNLVGFPPLMDCLKDAGIIEDDNSRMCKIAIAEPVID